MATKTDFLQMTLPLNNEFFNTWDQPLNDNLQKIDDFAAATDLEISNARFTKPSLAEFLAVSLNDDGTLLPTAEMLGGRNSSIYGDEDPVSALNYFLKQRLDVGDTEVWGAREGAATLRDGLAQRVVRSNLILSGSANSNGYPTWLGSTGAIARIDGSVTQVAMLIGGYRARTRVQESVTITGGAGTKYLFATFQASGVIRVDGDASSPPPSTANGITGADGPKVRIFSDTTIDFTTKDVKVGDILQILGGGTNAGNYLIRQVAPGGNVNQLKIFGTFPGGALSSLNYNVIDPLAPTYGFATAATPTAGRLYIGEADFDGSAITAVRAYHFKDIFIGEWRAIDVSGGSPTFEQIYTHKLGTDILDISVQVSQANDGSQPVEQLALGTLTSTLGVSINNTIVQAADVFNPGSTNASFTQGLLSGTVTGSLTGTIQPDRSISMKWDRNNINVKNPISAVFYKDYSGAVKQTGFIRVVISKRN